MLGHFTLFAESFAKAFVPLFVAMDPLGVIPIFLSFTEGTTRKERTGLIWKATLTALLLALLFLFSGKLIFGFLGITEADFKIGGGIVLLVLAVNDLLFSVEGTQRNPGNLELGVVPLGIPLIMGPAALTTILIMNDNYGFWPTLAALAANLVIVFFSFRSAHKLIGFFGVSASRAVAKVAALFLAAIAVMMIRSGITSLLS